MNSMIDPSPDRPGRMPDGGKVIAGPGRHDRVATRALPVRLLAAVRGLPAACWRRLDSSDRAALGMWAAAHLALFVLAWAAAWVYRGDTNLATRH
jgi:hypothetical protein